MKVLIVSHNCFSSVQSMGKTLSSLFAEFGKDELMQLYLYPSIPNINVCGSYYRITDSNILRSILKRKCCGRKIRQDEIKQDNSLFANRKEAEKYSSTKQNSFLMRRLRDVAWTIGNWKTRDLKEWLKYEKPDVVFYALGDATFSQNIARWISKCLRIPLVTYICDEFYFYSKAQSGWFNRLLSTPMTTGIKKTVKASKHLVTICDSLGKLYSENFGVQHTKIMTGSTIKAENIITNHSKKISFIGNTSLNRWKSMRDIADAIELINNETESKYEFVYYGKESSYLQDYKGIKYGGFLSPEEVHKVMRESCALIHTETFDKEYRERLRYSVSTKIADTLASGNCLFAYGPEDIASIQHLVENECAVVATRKEDLKIALINALEDSELRSKVSSNAIETAQKYHNSTQNSKLLKKVLQEIVENNNKL